MAYCTPAQLVDSAPRLKSLAQALDVAEVLLRATVDAGDRDDWSAEEIALADAALVSITQELARADGEIEARLARRGYTLPVDAAQFPILTTWARAIARYHLHADRSGEGADVVEGRIERDYLDARKALDMVAEGKLSLGAGDPLAVPAESSSNGAVRVTSKPRMFDRDTLGRL